MPRTKAPKPKKGPHEIALSKMAPQARKRYKARALAEYEWPSEWEIELGLLRVEKVEVKGDLLRVLLSSPDFEVEPARDGYFFSSPPLKVPDGTWRDETITIHNNPVTVEVENTVEDVERAFIQIVSEAATYYATHPEVHGRTTLTVFSDTSDGYVTSTHATYSTARSGASLVADDTPTWKHCGYTFSGGSEEHSIHELFFGFDTSSIPDDATVDDATLSLVPFLGIAGTCTIEARGKDWGPSVTTADWVAGDDVTDFDLLAELDTSGATLETYNAFTDVALAAAVDKTGTTRIMCVSDRHAAGTTPGANEYLISYLADETGTTKDPKLVINYSEAADPDATVEPAVLPLSTAFPQAGKSAGSTETPGVLLIPLAFPQAEPIDSGTPATVTPNPLAITTVFPQTAKGAGATKTPAAVTLAAGFPTPLAAEVEPGDIQGWTEETFIRSGVGEDWGGGNFVTRADGKVLVAYCKDEGTSVARVMLSVVDTEAELFTTDNAVMANEWEFAVIKGTDASHDRARLHHAPNGDLLLFVLEAQGWDASETDDAWLKVYRSANGNGTDFTFLADAWTGDPDDPVANDAEDCRLGHAINSEGRIIMGCTLPWPGSTNNSWFSSPYVIRSDDNGATWAFTRLAGLVSMEGKSIGKFSNGLFAVWTNDDAPGGRLHRSTDNGATWTGQTAPPNGTGLHSGMFLCGDYTYFIKPTTVDDVFTGDHKHSIWRAPVTASLPTTEWWDTTTDFWELVTGPLDGDGGYETMFLAESGEWIVFAGTRRTVGGDAFHIYGAQLQAEPEEEPIRGGISPGIQQATLAHVITAEDGRACYPVVGEWEGEESASLGQIGAGGRVTREFWEKHRDILEAGAYWWTRIRETNEVRFGGEVQTPSGISGGAVALRCHGAASLALGEAGRWFYAGYGTSYWATQDSQKRAGAPKTTLDAATNGAGNVEEGDHRYKVTFVTGDGETRPGPRTEITISASAKQVALTNIPIGKGFVTGRNIYRTEAGGSTYKLLTVIGNNTATTYTDNTADAGLGASPPTEFNAAEIETSVEEGSLVFHVARGASVFDGQTAAFICSIPDDESIKAVSIDIDKNRDTSGYVLKIQKADDDDSAFTTVATLSLDDDGPSRRFENVNGGPGVVRLLLEKVGDTTNSDPLTITLTRLRVFGRAPDEDFTITDMVRDVFSEIGADDEYVREVGLPGVPNDFTGQGADVLEHGSIYSGFPVMLRKEGLRDVGAFHPFERRIWRLVQPEAIDELDSLPLYNHVKAIVREEDGETRTYVEAFAEQTTLEERVTYVVSLSNPGTKGLAQHLVDHIVEIVSKLRLVGRIQTTVLADEQGVKWHTLYARAGDSLWHPGYKVTIPIVAMDLNQSLPALIFDDPVQAAVDRFNARQERRLTLKAASAT